jgi:hypothetical protein
MLVVLLAAVASPALANIDLVCPLCDLPEPIGTGELLELALGTMLRKGVAILLAGALVVVGLPWVVAGAAVAVFYLPERLRDR